MTWTRKECKTRAKEALHRNYWKIVLVSFLALIICGGSPGTGNRAVATASGSNDIQMEEDSGSYESDTDGSDTELTVSTDSEVITRESILVPEKVRMVNITVFILIAMFAIAFLYLLQALLANPFRVGFGRFMIKSIDDKANVQEIAYGFDHSYKNIVKTMFHYDLRVFLWSLLFIIPGFYKEYQYRLVPYILAEQPDMNYKDALQKSAALMNGHKWKAFVLDLSFIPWHIFGLITCGMGTIFYVTPYHSLTQAALYRKLSGTDTPRPEEAALLLSDTLQV